MRAFDPWRWIENQRHPLAKPAKAAKESRFPATLPTAQRESDSPPAERSGASSPTNVLVFPEPTTADLIYTLDYAQEQAATLTGRYRRELDRWLEIYRQGDWTDDDSIRAAFRRAITMEPPDKQPDYLIVPEEVFD
jgi:hypothetical protein